ncbi:MAG: autotransporter outer membrane beta-barrel domain-containing protein [Gemmatimonadetes bacterium]|nr:autotransporter outer membrane beta-barrel domain-containing protein [Gemmatimonadota bacterium]
MWGRGDFRAFEGRGGSSLGHDGELNTLWLGIDARADAWVAGVALSNGEGDADYAFSPGSSGRGGLDTVLTAVYPYGRWTVNGDTELRALAGAGTGEARHDAGAGGTETGELSMAMASLGIRHLLPEVAGMALALRGDASAVRLETDAGPDTIDGLSADAWRVRAGVEASRRIALDAGRAWEPFIEAALRRDGGDGLEGSGIELSGGVRYVAPGVQVEARGRWLAVHGADGAEEQGVSLTARADPGPVGRGLFLSLSPRWGTTTGGARALWNDAMPVPSAPGGGAVDARVGYGLLVPEAGGVLTPFAEAGLSGDDRRRLRLGTRFDALSMNLGLELAGERSENDGDAEPKNALRLHLWMRF